MTKHLFLDLEDTLIEPVPDGWPNARVIPAKIEYVRRVIAKYNPDFVHIFSFAIWDAAQRDRFNMWVRDLLESRLAVKFSAVPTTEDMIAVIKRVLKLSVFDFDDMVSLMGKHDAFRANMRGMFSQFPRERPLVEVMLIDDIVQNETFEWPDLNLVGTILNIDNPMEPYAFSDANPV
jgi:hypothetical protein